MRWRLLKSVSLHKANSDGSTWANDEKKRQSYAVPIWYMIYTYILMSIYIIIIYICNNMLIYHIWGYYMLLSHIKYQDDNLIFDETWWNIIGVIILLMLRYTLQWQKNIGLCIACSQYGQQLVPGTMGIDQQQTGFFQVSKNCHPHMLWFLN